MQINLNSNYSILYQMAYTMSFKEFKNKYCLFNRSQDKFYVQLKNNKYILKEISHPIPYENNEIFLDIIIRYKILITGYDCYYNFIFNHISDNKYYKYFSNYFIESNNSCDIFYKFLSNCHYKKLKLNYKTQIKIVKKLILINDPHYNSLIYR